MIQTPERHRPRPLARFACLLALAATLCAAQTAPPSYFEFGKVVAMGRGTVDIQTFDPQLNRTVQHSFTFSKDTKAEVVRFGDTVEVIYTADFTVRRLVVLSGGIPVAGAPPVARTGSAPAVASGSTPARAVPKASSVALPAPPPGARAAKAGSVATPTQVAGNQRTSTGAAVLLPGQAAGRVANGTVAAVDLGSSARPVVPGVRAVPLGSSNDMTAGPSAPSVKSVAAVQAAAECNRSDQGWPSQPITMAVLDFRYPTEREEAHDIGTTGGGSGTAVADLVFDRLTQNAPYLAISRGDRDKLYRADFAGAARLGRRMGVDAVLAGTFQPIDQPALPDGSPAPPVYELRAGIVDTCTGQLLERLSSAICPGGIDVGGTQSGCKRFSVTARQAGDPKETRSAFTPLLEAMLLPLEHGGTPPGQKGSAGAVSAVNQNIVTIQLAPGAKARPGDVIALHSWGLAKNASTYTLHRLQDEEIGRVTVSSVSGSTAQGTFTGDFQPRPGDTAESVTE